MKEVYIETHRVADTQGNVFAHLGFECFAGQTIITISTITTCFRMHISPCVVLWSQCTGIDGHVKKIKNKNQSYRSKSH